ncbi:histidinol-phosphatase [Pseudonocardia sp. CNS-139]|nr:histidinol-phosphatase [Pseudonocardia sp. CNS-139]
MHTMFSSDGRYAVQDHAAKARELGLDWIVVTDHGGPAHQKLSVDLVAPEIEDARTRHPDLLVYQGLEWNIPGAEHGTLFLPPGRDTVEILRAFEGAYDGSVLADRGVLPRATSPEGEPYALAGLRDLAEHVRAGRTEIALMIANHPARRGLDSPHELRGWRDTAPGVAVGMEGAPGHQAGGIPRSAGGPGGIRGYYEARPGPDSFRGFDPTPTENPYRTYGGFDWMTAKVGGMWDALLAEGRPWWVTATSDSHHVFLDTHVPGGQDFHATGSRGRPVDTGIPQIEGDFWPGFYSSTLVGAASRSYLDVMRALQAGQVVAVHGRLVDGLDVRVRALHDGDRLGVTLGGRTWVRRGGDVELTVEVQPAAGPNHGGEVPRPARIDVISGPVTGPAADRDAFTAPETAVVRTFEVGRRTIFTHTFSRVERPFYLRIRGSDGRKSDADGNPRLDEPGNAPPFDDLWFYANPVFVDVTT